MKKLILKDGTLCNIRAARVSDKDQIRRLFLESSQESRYYRFFATVNTIDETMINSMLRNDSYNAVLVCLVKGKIVAIANYYAKADLQSAEVSFFVLDKYQGKGIGTLLLEELAQKAWFCGIKELEAMVLADNYNMIGVFKSSGFVIEHEKLDLTSIHLRLALSRFERARSLHLVREKLATIASLKSAFEPQKLVFIGDKNSLLWKNILKYNTNAVGLDPNLNNVIDEVLSEKPDLLVINSVYCEKLALILEKFSVKVIIITVKLKNPAIKGTLVGLIKKYGTRLIGPNSTGLFYNSEDKKINISPINLPKSGNIAIATHSNLLGAAIVQYISSIGIGVLAFVSVGDKSDVSGNDLLFYWQDDDNVKMIVLYLDSFGDPVTFSLITKKITKQKPIFIVKAGKTQLSLAFSEHEVGMFSNTDVTVDGLFRQAGIIRADTIEELIDYIALMHACSFLPQSNRTAIISNSVGATIVAIDNFSPNDLELSVKPAYVEFGNDFKSEYEFYLKQMLVDNNVDNIVVIFAPYNDVEIALEDFLDSILEVVNSFDHKKIVILNILSHLYIRNKILEKENYKNRIAVFPFVERGLRSLGKLCWYTNFKSKSSDVYAQDLENFGIEKARDYIISLICADKVYQLTQSEVSKLFNELGINTIPRQSDVLYSLGIGMAYDKLFGPILGISIPTMNDYSQINIVYKAQIVRLLPLSDVKEIIEAIESEHEMSFKIKSNFEDFIIRLSEAFLQIPEIIKIDLPFIFLQQNGINLSKTIIKVQSGGIQNFTKNS